MTVDERNEAIASFIDATREIVEAGRIMGSTLAAIRSELAASDGQKAREEIAALHVESARYAARAKRAEDQLVVARTRIAALEARIQSLNVSPDVSSIKSNIALDLPPEPRLEDYLDRPWSETLDVSTRLRRMLVRLDRSTLRDVLEWSEVDFFKQRGFGRTMLSELKEALASVGARLARGSYSSPEARS